MFRYLLALLVWTSLLYYQLDKFIFSQPYESLQDQLDSARAEIQKPKISKEKLTDKNRNIFWFIHISDLHVSRFVPHQGYHNLQRFLNETLKMVNPKFVAVTGDLTDAKDKLRLSSKQYVDEWTSYHDLLNQFGITSESSFWFDLRGNHDCFDVPSVTSHLNYFKRYSITKNHEMQHTWDLDFGKYSLISMDGCPNHGLGRPFNFFGYFDGYDLQMLNTHLNKGSDSNHTFLLNHYPSSTMLYKKTPKDSSFGFLSSKISLYLCGHLHKLVGKLGHEMYAKYSNEFLELEIGDLKHSKMFRVISVDNDLISFSDVTLDDEIVIVVTNPKDARFLLPSKEPLHLIKTSTHIRMLIFSKNLISSLNVFVDEKLMGIAKQDGNLWTVEWNPSSYAVGIHHLNITAIDILGNRVFKYIEFSVDGSSLPILSYGHSVITWNAGRMIKITFWMLYFVILVGMLLIPKLFIEYLKRTCDYDKWREEKAYELARFHHLFIDTNESSLWKWFYFDSVWFVLATSFRLTELANHSTAFNSLFVYGLYIVIGPWTIGEFAPSSPNYSALYVYGLVSNGEFLPILDSWLYGVFQLAYVYMPVTIFLSFQTCGFDLYQTSDLPNLIKFVPFHERWFVKIFLVICYVYQIFNILMVIVFFGPVAFLLSPGKTWFSVVATWLLVQTYRQKVPKRLKLKGK